MNSTHFLLTVILFIIFIPDLFFTLPPCSKNASDLTNKWVKNITHAVLFALVFSVLELITSKKC
jgi:hypothetical protein